jgi:hypothetical protein
MSIGCKRFQSRERDPPKGCLLAMQNGSLYLDMVNVVPVGHVGKDDLISLS